MCMRGSDQPAVGRECRDPPESKGAWPGELLLQTAANEIEAINEIAAVAMNRAPIAGHSERALNGFARLGDGHRDRSREFAGFRFPDFDRVVFANRNDSASVRRERHALDLAAVTSESAQQAPARQVPELHRAVVGA